MTVNSSFTCITANDLETITMIAGDQQDLEYNILDSAGSVVDLNGATCSVKIFPFGDPTYTFVELAGSISASPVNQFTAILTSGCSTLMSGAYLQQAIIVDYLGKKHIPSQGKIIVFPSPND